jgi:hypothetical protein
MNSNNLKRCNFYDNLDFDLQFDRSNDKTTRLLINTEIAFKNFIASLILRMNYIKNFEWLTIEK